MNKFLAYKFYSLLKSTSIVMVIFPLFLYQYYGLNSSDIIWLSGYFFLLPLILEIPLGVLADRLGNRLVVSAGMIFFIAGFVSLLLFSGKIAYIVYLWGITIAASCFSGADDAILLDVLPQDKSIFAAKSELYMFIYIYSTVFLFISGFLYDLYPYLPVILQILSLTLAFFLFLNLSSNLQKSSSKTNLISVMRSASKDFFNGYVIIWALLLSFSGVVVLLNNRVITLEFYKIFPFKDAGIISLIYIFSNFISSIANLGIKHAFKGFSKPFIPIIIIGSLALAAFWAMSIQHYAAVVLGFFILTIFKVAYRSYLNGSILETLLHSQAVATVLSFISILSAILGFALSSLYAIFADDFKQASIVMALLTLLVFSISLLGIYLFRDEITYIQPSNSASNKKHYIRRKYQQLSYGQIYPDSVSINNFIRENIYVDTSYPSPKILSLGDNFIEWQYIRGSSLAEVDKDMQQRILSSLAEIFRKNLAQNTPIIHGDLQPDNIMVVDDKNYFSIDWDLCQAGAVELDILTLITSPRLSLSLSERIAYFTGIIPKTIEETEAIFNRFINNKISQLEASELPLVSNMVEGYKEILYEFKQDKSYYIL